MLFLLCHCNFYLMMAAIWCRVQMKRDGTPWHRVGGGKWRGNLRMEWVASTLHFTSEHGVSSITTADSHTSAASSRLNWRPCRFKLTRSFYRKTKCGFCACAITFQTQSTLSMHIFQSVVFYSDNRGIYESLVFLVPQFICSKTHCLHCNLHLHKSTYVFMSNVCFLVRL
jgi:hypothetical protein